jgi:hypothetical protein
MIVGYGQGLVMAPLSSVVLSTVPPRSAGSGSGVYGTTTQIGNAAGIAAIGALYFVAQSAFAGRGAILVSLAACAVSIAASVTLLMWMRRVRAE